MKKRVRRGGPKEGQPGYLQSASETDSALEDSGTESDDDDNDTAHAGWDAIVDNVREDQTLKPALNWLKNCMESEKEDREADDEEPTDVPVVPLADECVAAMDSDKFT